MVDYPLGLFSVGPPNTIRVLGHNDVVLSYISGSYGFRTNITGTLSKWLPYDLESIWGSYPYPSTKLGPVELVQW